MDTSNQEGLENMKNLKEVDWNKAPNGATHYNEDCGCPWLKESPPSYYGKVNGNWAWIKYTSGIYKDHFFNAVKRPQEMENEEWDGIGIPPIGTVCEYYWSEGMEWRKCEVVAYHLVNVVAVDALDSSAVSMRPMMFRFIKTPEQIAAEERSKAIDDMYDLVNRKYSSFKDMIEALYDAGYRKIE